MINPFSLPNMICSIFAIGIGIIVLIQNIKIPTNRSFFYLTLSVSFWQITTFFLLNSSEPGSAEALSRIVYIGAIFIPITTYHLVVNFLHLTSQVRLLRLVYLIGLFFFLPFSQTKYFLSGVYKYYWGYWFKASILHPLFLLFFGILMWISFYNLYWGWKKSDLSLDKLRKKYIFLSLLIAYIGGVDFIPNYGFAVYPFSFIPIIVCISILAYAIIRYRLMDIKVAITRTGIFVVVYSLVLGIPFALAVFLKDWLKAVLADNWWLLPLGLMAFLGTLGPFVFLYLQHRAEARLLREQRRYQDILKQASLGMTRIRNLKKLLNLIVHIITKTVKISSACIYLYDQEKDSYLLVASRGSSEKHYPQELKASNPLIAWIRLRRQAIVYEEVLRKSQDNLDIYFKYLESQMRSLSASVIIPSFLEDQLIGFLILGEKRSGQIYTQEDLDVFSVLASQAGLAIENAQFYEHAQKMQEQVAQAEKMATIGTMADGLSHQINNRLYALSLIAGDTLDTLKMTDISGLPNQIKEVFNQVNHALGRIQANVLQAGEIVRGLLKYSRAQEDRLEPLDLDNLLNQTLEMVQFKVKLSEIEFNRDYDPQALPQIKGNQVQLQEVFFNLIDNAYDAILERRNSLNEPNYQGKITISAFSQDSKFLKIIVEDNGIGIKEENLKKLFTPFFTTKTSSRKGTGLGLYVIRKIVTDNHQGRINVESKYCLGTRFIIELPIWEE